MDVQINTDNRISGSADLAAHAESRIRERLERYSSRLTRVEMHARDVDGSVTAGADGIEVTLEARPAGQQPVSVSGRARVLDAAFNEALSKLGNRLESAFGKLDRIR